MHATSRKYNDTPAKASRPWDKDRDGFVLGKIFHFVNYYYVLFLTTIKGEGAGALVLEV